jgi:hypothetical protein
MRWLAKREVGTPLEDRLAALAEGLLADLPAGCASIIRRSPDTTGFPGVWLTLKPAGTGEPLSVFGRNGDYEAYLAFGLTTVEVFVHGRDDALSHLRDLCRAVIFGQVSEERWSCEGRVVKTAVSGGAFRKRRYVRYREDYWFHRRSTISRETVRFDAWCASEQADE